MDDALPNELLVAIAAACDPADALAPRAVARRWRDACDEAAADDAWLRAHCDALRVRLGSAGLRARWAQRRRRHALEWRAPPPLRCARCGAPTRGVLACGCHDRPRAPAFPWTRALAGPLAAALAVAALAALR